MIGRSLQLVATMAILSSLASPLANAGRILKGGDPTAIEFIHHADEAIQAIEQNPVLFPEIKGHPLRAILQQAKILVTDQVLMVERNGVQQESVAVNWASPDTITINRSSWQAIKAWQMKDAVALHEILGLAKIENTGVYSVSHRYLDLPGVYCKSGDCSNEIENSAFDVESPSSGTKVSGTIHFRGLAGSKWINTAVYNWQYTKLSNDVTPENHAFSIDVDTTQLADGPHRLYVKGFDVPPGVMSGNTAEAIVFIDVQNHVELTDTRSSQ
jgi:hypothetical protein